MSKWIVVDDRWVNKQLRDPLSASKKFESLFQSLKKRLLERMKSYPLAFPGMFDFYLMMISVTVSEIKKKGILMDMGKILESRGMDSVRADLSKLINRVPDFQVFLYMTEKWYRDHIMHAIRVGVLGEFMLKQRFDFGSKICNLDEMLAYLTGISTTDIREAWWISALFHDIAQPLTKLSPAVNELVSEVVGAYSPLVLDLQLGEPKLILTPTEERMFDKLINGMDQPLQDRLRVSFSSGSPDHGIVSAMFVLRSAGEDKFEAPHYLRAARAISLHDRSDISIEFEKEPLTYLLVVCDELQEWGREVKVRSVKKFEPSFETVTLVDKLRIRLDLKELDAQITFSDQRSKEKCGFLFDRFSLDKRNNIQRLRAIGLAKFPKLRIKLINQVYEDGSLLSEVRNEIQTP